MIPTILDSSGSASGALEYNEKKVDREVATVARVYNLRSDCKYCIVREFDRREHLPQLDPHIKNAVLHIAMSPGGKDNCDPENVLAFLDEFIREIGYENQPVVIYRHEDIERGHYHIVASKIKEDGHVVRNNFIGTNWEKLNMESIVRKIGPKYGIYFGTGEDEVKEKSLDVAPEVRKSNRFVPTALNARDNMRYLFEEATKYNFTTPAQFKDILSAYGVFWPLPKEELQGKIVTLQGMDELYRRSSTRYTFRGDENTGLRAILLKRLQENRAATLSPVSKCDREQLRYLAAVCLDLSKNADEFRAAMESIGIVPVVKREGQEVRRGRPKTIRELPSVESVCLVNKAQNKFLNDDETKWLAAEISEREKDGRWDRRVVRKPSRKKVPVELQKVMYNKQLEIIKKYSNQKGQQTSTQVSRKTNKLTK